MKAVQRRADSCITAPTDLHILFRGFQMRRRPALLSSLLLVGAVSAASFGMPAATASGTAAPGSGTSTATVTAAGSWGYTGHAGLYGYGMAFDKTDNSILVADLWNYRVKRYTTGGSPKGVVSKVAPRGASGGIGAPFGVASDPSGSVWVADQSNSRVVQFSHSGTWLQTIGYGGDEGYGVGCGGGKMTIPTHVIVDPTNRDVYVTDPRCRTVYVFSSTGRFLRQFNWSGAIPRGIAMDAAGNVYVADFTSRRIHVFNKAGTRLRDLGAAPNDRFGVNVMADVRGIALDAANNRILAVGAANNWLVSFRTSGGYNTAWGGPDSAFNTVRFVAADNVGNMYVSDLYGYKIWKLTAAGAIDQAFAKSNAGVPAPPPNGGMNQNNGIALDSQNNLYVVDTFENRIQKFSTASQCTSRTSCPAYTMTFPSARGTLGQDDGNIDYPHAIAYGAGGYLWLEAPNAVLKLSTAGAYLGRFGSHGKAIGQFSNGPQGIDVAPYGASDAIYTVDVGNCRLQVQSPSGSLLSYMSTCGSSTLNQMNGPRQIDVRGGLAYVADTGNSRIAVWDIAQKRIVRVIGGFNQPRGARLDPSGSWLYVGDSGNKRIMRVKPDGTSPQVVATSANGRAFGGPEYIEFATDGRMFVSDNTQSVYAFRITG